jgi:8-oxo-dGTP pyrophosphatase MutT (NUDIX family)
VSEFEISRREEILRSYVFTVDRVVVNGPEGEFEREIVKHPGAVAVVAVNASNEVALLRQWRATVGGDHFEIPAGTRDVGSESPLETAKRELLEEIGATSDDWLELCTFLNSPGWTDQETVVFLARNVSISKSRPSGPEESSMTVTWVHRDAIADLMRPGSHLDGTVTIGLRAWLALT